MLVRTVRASSSLALAAAVTALVACRSTPSPECDAYVACQNAYDAALEIDPANGGVDTAQYEAGGDCWATEALATRCSESCLRAIESLRSAAAAADVDVPECAL